MDASRSGQKPNPGQLYGSTVRGEQLEVSVSGRRAAVLDINPRMTEADPNGMNLQTPRSS